MLGHEPGGSSRSALIDIIRQVRKRWRMKLALRGAARFLAAAVLVLIASAYALEALRFSPAAILIFRVVVALALLGSAAWFLVMPLLRRVSDEQVALYLEEHEPTLEATIITAMEAEQSGRTHEMSPTLVRRLVEAAVERCHEIEEGRRVERMPIRRYAVAAGVVTAVALAIFALGPSYLRQALSALLVISRGVEAAAPYRIVVTPGNADVPRGADQTITAMLEGFQSAEATLVMRKSPTEAYERLQLARMENGSYEGMLFDMSNAVEYFVEASGVRSPVFNLKIVDLPYVKQLDLEYHFPAYTGLAPRTVEDGGDIAALRGTNVNVKITPTMQAKGGRILLDDGTALPLAAGADGTFTAQVAVAKQGFYRVELDALAGEKVAASPQYTIDLLSDQAPSVALSKPGRDTNATPVEEFFIEVRADDDYAVRDLQLVYSINGGEDKTLRLFDGKKPMPEVTAGHTFYLEELGVQAGDSVSYYARAIDNDTVQGPNRATSDIYFLRIRPFGKDFKPAASMGGGGGGGGAGQEVGALSQQQRQIIAGTFKVQRDRKTMGADKVREALVVLALSQSKLREQVEGLVERMNSRLVTPDPSFTKIAEVLPLAAAEMKAAEGKLQAQNAEAALPPENKALQHLQQAEEEYELQVQTQRQAGGGGGGGAGSIAEDLADLFKLELDRMANQYETNQRASAESAERQVDELAEKLKELARRQEQELERQRRMAAGQSPRGSADLQRALAEQAQEAARQLERLSREQNRADLREAARRMQEAADAMKRASANGDPSASAQAAAAAERLREAQRQLQGAQGARAERAVNDALREAEEALEEQRQIAEDVRGLQSLGATERSFKSQLLGERKEALEGKVAELEKDLDKASGEVAREARETSRKMQQAAEQIRDDKIKEKLRYSRSLVSGAGDQEFARKLEDDIGNNLDKVRGTLRDAQRALGPGGRDRTAETLDKAREIARGVESLGRRMQERAGQQGQQGQRGQQGKQAQQGQQGQQSPQGEQGQQGQQQGQQGQRGQQGQQGQGGQDGQGGERNADGRGGDGDTVGPWREGGWGLGGDRRPGDWFSPDDVRQFSGEVGRWTTETRQLREMLREQNLDTKQLDEILRRLRELEDTRNYRDIAELERLQTLITEGMKRFEYDLRRKVGSDTDRALLNSADEVPPQFRKLVEEYYRSLSKGQQPPRQ